MSISLNKNDKPVSKPWYTRLPQMGTYYPYSEQWDATFTYFILFMGVMFLPFVLPVFDGLISLLTFVTGIPYVPFSIMDGLQTEHLLIGLRLWFWISVIALVATVRIERLQRNYAINANNS